MTAQPWIARLYPERRSSLYVRVQVWPNKRTMLAYLNAHHFTIHGNRFGSRTAATCSAVTRTTYAGGRPRRLPCFAEVNFYRGRLGIEVISHELFHATMRWAGRAGFDLSRIESLDCTMHEERITYVHGRLCAQLMHKGLRPGGIYGGRDTATGQ